MTTTFFVYSICFGVGLLFTIASAFMAHIFGGGHEGQVDVSGGHAGDVGGAHGGADGHAGTAGHAEAGFNNQDMPGFSPVSPTTIASFITAFGGFGMIFTNLPLTRSPWVSAPLATLSGFAIAGMVFWLFHKVFSWTQSSSESRVDTLVGETATVITPIPENAVGEIAYVQLGTRYTAPARAEEGLPVPSGQAVKITRIVGAQFYVVPV